MEADRMAAPQGPCPLPGGAGLAGIESRDDGPPPHGHAARSAGAAVSAQNASGSGCRQSRPEAQASRPWIHAAFGPCGTRAVLAAAFVAAHAGAKKGARHAQSHQHNSATVRGKGAVDTTVKPMKSFSETSMFMALASLGCFRPGRNRMRCDEKAPPAGWREGRESGGAAPGTT